MMRGASDVVSAEAARTLSEVTTAAFGPDRRLLTRLLPRLLRPIQPTEIASEDPIRLPARFSGRRLALSMAGKPSGSMANGSGESAAVGSPRSSGRSEIDGTGSAAATEKVGGSAGSVVGSNSQAFVGGETATGAGGPAASTTAVAADGTGVAGPAGESG